MKNSLGNFQYISRTSTDVCFLLSERKHVGACVQFCLSYEFTRVHTGFQLMFQAGRPTLFGYIDRVLKYVSRIGDKNNLSVCVCVSNNFYKLTNITVLLHQQMTLIMKHYRKLRSSTLFSVSSKSSTTDDRQNLRYNERV